MTAAVTAKLEAEYEQRVQSVIKAKMDGMYKNLLPFRKSWDGVSFPFNGRTAGKG